MAIHLTGACTCRALQYAVDLDSADQARTSLCHCLSCRRAFGTPFGTTTKVSVERFKYVQGQPKLFRQENGVIREFCDNCGVFICEYGEQAEDKFRYIMWGTLDEPERLPPKGEFFCSSRASWMPEVPGIFHKQEIKQ